MNWTHAHFTRAVADNAALLAADDERDGGFKVPVPPFHPDRLAWMQEMMRRYATGAETLLACARRDGRRAGEAEATAGVC